MSDTDKTSDYHLLDLASVEIPTGVMAEHRTASINNKLMERIIAVRSDSDYGPILDSSHSAIEYTRAELEDIANALADMDQPVEQPTTVALEQSSLPEPTEISDETESVDDACANSQASEPTPESPAPQMPPETMSTLSLHTPVTSAEISTAMTSASPDTERLQVQGEISTDTEHMLYDVQATLENLAGMARGLAQQKLETEKHRDNLDSRHHSLQEKERHLQERDEHLRQQQNQLQRERASMEQLAENNARVLAERSTALQKLAESIEARDKASAKRAEALEQDQQRQQELADQLRQRLAEVEKREVALQRRDTELNEKFKQLLGAKERFGAIVRSFNETMVFNDGLHAISKTAFGDEN
ncbi:hypothetical protein JVX91_13095 [Pseudomonas sp. PDNC002]|uniref:hypothetical protein n=1 Tax=Pseudomonas sp. PDNC002 TaxID=2811422 RepID=UPI0019630FC3|nr:hypothetical protein [Pseudomonas sp. PDNC002]QRY81990.1 hypothetical protein JVX91_13095 [Pseudomonas sp. PDNC002]